MYKGTKQKQVANDIQAAPDRRRAVAVIERQFEPSLLDLVPRSRSDYDSIVDQSRFAGPWSRIGHRNSVTRRHRAGPLITHTYADQGKRDLAACAVTR